MGLIGCRVLMSAGCLGFRAWGEPLRTTKLISAWDTLNPKPPNPLKPEP